MEYKAFYDLLLSRLGYGAMRLPTTSEGGGAGPGGGVVSAVDEERALEVIGRAYEAGINYFDTAYRYHGGESERVLGRALRRYPRETWHVASKFPGHMMQARDGRMEFTGYMAGNAATTPADIFEEQLAAVGVDHFDLYLLHNVCESSYDTYTDEQLGIIPYLQAQRRAGRIRHLGFSTHARPETLERFLSREDGFEFVQIQLNYLDWTLQDARKKYEIVTARGLPVMVMEPVRGGRLADLGDELNARLKAARPDESIASWAMRYCQSLPGVRVVLSGMTTLEQLEDNVRTFCTPAPLTRTEHDMLAGLVDALGDRVPCTACRYCCDDCPQRLDIPTLIAMYNQLKYGGSAEVAFGLRALQETEMPWNCISCGACTAACPQRIDVPEVMRDLTERLRAMPAGMVPLAPPPAPKTD
jgi:predicted aldo/keto reductase-like oxidoreductase